ncbi:adenomatous polyposis coli protein isoform X1 [Phycodurus eques]|uniref:adenomatous polyposis coli protein isoform X1 n=1 Tax=Phycodurus eques TaxID=693459 RepID=UPI002ACDAC04|nr:adenomatous polyposis coli protein isoform X1 [Phycodurus eques]XP_061553734.1 adenomatous polyposis coli protein isoform X1 [Phycodurus eques]
MAAGASYDQLLRQVEVLKMENSNLRQELQDNSNHLTKLETEASNMKEVLKQLQGTIEEDSEEASGSQLELIVRLKEMSLDPAGFKARQRPPAPPSSSSSSSSSGGAAGGSAGSNASATRRGLPPVSRDGHERCLEELEKERALLLAELEKEEKEKGWYYAQLLNLTKRIDSLPLSENFTLQTDMSRRQLEFEARQIHAAMEQQLGSRQEMEKRAEARTSRIHQIEKEIVKLGARLQVEASHGSNESSGGGLAAASQNPAPRLDQEPANETAYSVPRRITSHLGTKVEMVYSLLSMLGTHDKDDMSRTLLAMSSSQDSCIAMRQSGCLPLLIQLLHGNDKDSLLLGNSRGSKEARARASAALHNIVHSQPDDKRGRREIRVLHLLEQVRHYCEDCWSWQENHERGVDQEDNPMPSPVDHQICPAVCVLMKLSFDEEHRHAMNELGGLQAVAELLQVDCEMLGLSGDHYSVTLRRYAGMALTNLTFGDVANKATLCSMKGCMRAMVTQLKSESEDLQQVIASVLRNLSWRADVNSKKTLREVGSVRALMGCALDVQKESTLKSVLSALWNLSAHCTENKADICSVDGALAFLVGTLTHRSHTNTLAIIESGGGILRNVSSLIATNEAYRHVLREHGCLPTLLQHLKSHSLTIVSNACGTLWNLSARDAKDQEALWELGAVGTLRNLIHSRHKMIAMGSAAALRNLMANRPARYKDASVVSPGAGAPSLHARKQKALFKELDAQQLSETFDNIDNLSPKVAHRKGRSCNGGGGAANATRSYTNTPVLSSPKTADGSKRSADDTAYTRPVFGASVRASSDSLNSVTSVDGYGNRGKTKPSSEPLYSSDDSGANRCCVYRKYPADLAHKIRSVNHMADDDGAEVDTPINYSLKYSDEQLNSGRQSPSHRGRTETDNDDEQAGGLRLRSDGAASVTANGRVPPAPPSCYVVAAASDYGGDTAPEQPIDYSLKYGDISRKALFKVEDSTDAALPPPPAGKPRQPHLPPKGHQESTQTYCVEDTPICFSGGSSLSSLSPEEEEEDADAVTRKRQGAGDERRQRRQHKEVESQTAAATAPAVRGRRAHHHGHAHHHHHQAAAGARTPKSPPEQPYAQETPLMFSRCTSVSSLDSFSTSSIASSVRSSEPCSGMPSGVISPSDLPDSPGQTMPPSRAKTPPPQALPPPPAKSAEEEKAAKKEVEETGADVLLHFATESTPHGFSYASSLSALSLDEPFIAAEMKLEDGGDDVRKEEGASQQMLQESDDDDDDTQILEACIIMAMPKSSRKPKQQQQQQQQQGKASQLPVYKLLPPQRKESLMTEEVPRVYCVEGTPLNFSTATSLSDLTIDSPPNEEPAAAAPPTVAASSLVRRTGLPEGENGDDILAECISAAMPKAKPRKPIRASSNGELIQPPPPAPPLFSPQHHKKPPGPAGRPLSAAPLKPTSPVKPTQRAASVKVKPGFTFDTPHHYTPIEGTPCCFSRNDSLSSLDFDDDDKDEDRKRHERDKKAAAVFPQSKAGANPPAMDEKQKFAIEDTPVCFSRNSSLSSLSDIDQENNNNEFAAPRRRDGRDDGDEPAPLPPSQADAKARLCNYTPKAFHVEDTPVCFSRNSSLSSLSIDSEDDLLQECISSAMPKKKKKSAAAPLPAATSPLPAPKEEDGILAEEEPSEVPRSPASPDSESFDWKAIQEGANSIVSSLNAAASSLSRQGSSDSDSVLSLKSVGSPFRLQPPTANPPEEEAPSKRGAKVVKPSADDKKKKDEDEAEELKVVKGRKKVYRSLITGKPRAELAARGRSKPRAAAVAKAPGSGDSSRDSTPSRSSHRGGRPSQLPRTVSPGNTAAANQKTAAKPGTAARGAANLPKQEKAEPEKPTLVRQSTFIKEAPSPTLKRKLEESTTASCLLDVAPPTSRRQDAVRSQSESPSRPQDGTAASRLSRTGTWKRESKHSSSLPRVGTWKRTGSSSSVLSASSESSEKGRSEEEASVRSKGTWRRAKSAGVGDAFVANNSEEVWVRLEDCPVNNPRSSSSCSARSPNAPPVIPSPAPSKIPSSSSSSSSSNLNLRRSCDSLDEKPPPPQRLQQRSGAVAARVSPFNYTPSPRKSNPDSTASPAASTVSPATATATTTSATPTRPSLIPTPVTKKREPKGGEGGGSGGGERGSYIVTSV